MLDINRCCGLHVEHKSPQSPDALYCSPVMTSGCSVSENFWNCSLSNIHRRERKMVFPPTRTAEIPPYPLRGCCRTHVGYKTAFDISNYCCVTVDHIRWHSGMQAFIYQDLIGFHVTRRPKARGLRGCGCLTALHLSGPSHWHAP